MRFLFFIYSSISYNYLCTQLMLQINYFSSYQNKNEGLELALFKHVLENFITFTFEKSRIFGFRGMNFFSDL